MSITGGWNERNAFSSSWLCIFCRCDAMPDSVNASSSPCRPNYHFASRLAKNVFKIAILSSSADTHFSICS